LKNDRFLIGILIGIVLIIVAALGAFFLRQNANTYLPEDTPNGIVNNYILALYDQDYEKAYSYLAEGELKPSFDTFRQAFVSGSLYLGNVSFKISETSESQKQATVYLTYIYSASGPFNEPYRESQMATLVLENGIWKITNMPYPLWNWDWYQEVPQK